MHGGVVAAAGPDDQLRQSAYLVQPLEVVIVAAEHEPGVTEHGLPQQGQVGLVAVEPGAEARTVPERDRARSVAVGLELALEPAQLVRVRGVWLLRRAARKRRFTGRG